MDAGLLYLILASVYVNNVHAENKVSGQTYRTLPNVAMDTSVCEFRNSTEGIPPLICLMLCEKDEMVSTTAMYHIYMLVFYRIVFI